jgi:hypothetical protein
MKKSILYFRSLHLSSPLLCEPLRTLRFHFKDMQRIFSLMLLLMTMLIYSCSSKVEEAEVQQSSLENEVTLSPEQFQNAGIEIGKIEQRAISSILRVNGRVDVPPQNMVSVSVPMGGYLKYTKLLPGMHLNKGEVIAVMEDQLYIQLQQDYLTAKARLIFQPMNISDKKN